MDEPAGATMAKVRLWPYLISAGTPEPAPQWDQWRPPMVWS